jgi:hypothetical protein
MQTTSTTAENRDAIPEEEDAADTVTLASGHQEAVAVIQQQRGKSEPQQGGTLRRGMDGRISLR